MIDLTIHAKGDLHVDEHHTIETRRSRLVSVCSLLWATNAA